MTQSRTRLDPKDRKRLILQAAIATAKKKRLFNMTRIEVAAAAGCSAPLVGVHFKTMDALRDAVLAEAIKTRDLSLVAQGIAIAHPRCKRLSAELRAQAIADL